MYACQECGASANSQLWICPGCGHTGTIQKQITKKSKSGAKGSDGGKSKAVPAIPLTRVKSNGVFRYQFESQESNRVFGGGLTVGSLSLIAGEPNAGKSTWLRQRALEFARSHGTVLYVSGEESESQIKQAFDRFGESSDKILVSYETDYETIFGSDNITGLIEIHKPDFLIVDSINTIRVDGVASGSVSQLKYLANAIMNRIKTLNITTFLVGHVTKEGSVAGPKELEHMVDAVFYLEIGDVFRFLRSIKNRNGDTSEVGIVS